MARDYWLSQAIAGSVSAADKPDEWRDGMAILAQSHEHYRLHLMRAQVQIWAPKFK